jgi:hypothetical protein
MKALAFKGITIINVMLDVTSMGFIFVVRFVVISLIFKFIPYIMLSYG